MLGGSGRIQPRLVRLMEPRRSLRWPILLGVVLIGGMGFTCAQLVRHRELVAVLASGVSLRRIARPILIVAIMLIGLQALNQELVLPRIAPLLTRDHGEAGKRGLGADRVKLVGDIRTGRGEFVIGDSALLNKGPKDSGRVFTGECR